VAGGRRTRPLTWTRWRWGTKRTRAQDGSVWQHGARSATIALGGAVITPRSRQVCIYWEACTKFLARCLEWRSRAIWQRMWPFHIGPLGLSTSPPHTSPLSCACIASLPAAPDACNPPLLALPRLHETQHLASRETPRAQARFAAESGRLFSIARCMGPKRGWNTCAVLCLSPVLLLA